MGFPINVRKKKLMQLGTWMHSMPCHCGEVMHQLKKMFFNISIACVFLWQKLVRTRRGRGTTRGGGGAQGRHPLRNPNGECQALELKGHFPHAGT